MAGNSYPVCLQRYNKHNRNDQSDENDVFLINVQRSLFWTVPAVIPG